MRKNKAIKAGVRVNVIAATLLVLSACTELPVPTPHIPWFPTKTPVSKEKKPPLDLWARIRKSLVLKQDTHREGVQKQLLWFQKHPNYLNRALERATPFLHYIVEMAESRRMPAEVVLLPITESAYNPLADSPQRAAGLWQIIPSTAEHLGLRQSWWYDGRRDIHASTTAALNYLAYLHRYFGGDWLLAFAAYNAGEGTIAKAIDRNRKMGKPTDFWSLKLPSETSAYVPSLLALSEVVSQPDKYRINLKPIVNQNKIVKVDVRSQVDLSFAAHMANLKIEELYALNPGFFRWATDPEGPHYLLLPEENAKRFQQKLASFALHERIIWQSYRVRSGDTLLSISNKFHASPDQIRSKNKLGKGPLQPGRTIMVPQVSRVPSHVKLPRLLPAKARPSSLKYQKIKKPKKKKLGKKL